MEWVYFSPYWIQIIFISRIMIYSIGKQCGKLCSTRNLHAKSKLPQGCQERFTTFGRGAASLFFLLFSCCCVALLGYFLTHVQRKRRYRKAQCGHGYGVVECVILYTTAGLPKVIKCMLHCAQFMSLIFHLLIWSKPFKFYVLPYVEAFSEKNVFI